jgi:hypothetical protein
MRYQRCRTTASSDVMAITKCLILELAALV